MRVDAIPAHATLILGQPLVVSVQVYNTAPVISAYTVRVLGVDPAWVTLDQDQLSLFPGHAGFPRRHDHVAEGHPRRHAAADDPGHRADATG